MANGQQPAAGNQRQRTQNWELATLTNYKMINHIFSTLAPIIFVIFIGYLFGRFIHINVRQLTDVSLYIFTSSLVFYIVVNTQVPTTNILLMGCAIALLFSTLALIGITIGKLKHFSQNFMSAFLLCILFVNSGNMGLPFNLFAYGQPGLEIASLYLIFSAILTHSIGIFIAARGKRSTRFSLLTIFKLPLIYAVFSAIMVRTLHITRPLFIFTSIELLYQAAVPMLLIILGIQIAQTNVTKNWWKLNYILFIRLLLSPFVAFAIAQFLGMNGLLKKVFIIQSAMPIAINSAILAIKFDTRANFVTNAVVISTIFSVVSLALIFVFVEMVG